MTNSFINRTYK